MSAAAQHCAPRELSFVQHPEDFCGRLPEAPRSPRGLEDGIRGLLTVKSAEERSNRAGIESTLA